MLRTASSAKNSVCVLQLIRTPPSALSKKDLALRKRQWSWRAFALIACPSSSLGGLPAMASCWWLLRVCAKLLQKKQSLAVQTECIILYCCLLVAGYLTYTYNLKDTPLLVSVCWKRVCDRAGVRACASKVWAGSCGVDFILSTVVVKL